jgi:chromosome segregation ATPase
MPTRSFNVIVEPMQGEHGMTERKVGMYTCSKCGTKFPTVISRQRYLIVAEEQLKSIQDELNSVKKGNEDLNAKVQGMIQQQREMENSMDRTAKENELKRLQTRLGELEEFVGYLRKEKGELEQKASRFR